MIAAIEPVVVLGQPAIALQCGRGARAVVSLFGAQVLSWTPAGGEERLYLSDKAVFDGASAVRGGVPVCFPQFAALGKLPQHGFARTRNWALTAQRTGTDFALATLSLGDDEETWAMWPHGFRSEITVVIEGARLDVELEVENTGHGPFAFTAALHSYLRVREVENCRLEGLHGFEYRDKVDQDRIQRETGDAVVVDAEIDRVYHDVTRPLLLSDGGRSLAIHAEGFPDVVVWNPWEARCATLRDMPTLGFRHMLCVEAAAARTRVQLDAGETWAGRQTLIAL